MILVAMLLMLQPPAEAKQLADVLPRLQDKDTKVRLQAAIDLSKWPVELEPKALAALAKVIDDADPKVRRVVIQTLGEVGPRAREWAGGPRLAGLLAKKFQDTDTMVKRAAVWTYGQVGVDSLEELQPLVAVLKDPSPDLRGLAITSLGQYVHEKVTPEWRASVLDSVATALADRDARVQRLAAELLLKSGADAVPALTRVVDKGAGSARLWAALVLGEIGPAARDALPSLQKAAGEVKDPGRVVQAAIKKIGG